jgi:hypothetical protein
VAVRELLRLGPPNGLHFCLGTVLGEIDRVPELVRGATCTG